MYILSANPKKSRIFEKYYQYKTVYWKTDILVEMVKKYIFIAQETIKKL